MSGVLHGIVSALKASAAAATDAFFEYVSLLLPGSGTNGAQNNTFLDASTNNFTITRNGNATQGTFSPYGDNWSNFFDGTGDNLSVPSNAAFHFGSGDLTVEAWVYWAGATPSTPTGNVIIQNGNGSNASGSNWYLGFSYSAGGTQKISFYLYSSSTETEFRSSTNLPMAAWTHIAAVRSGNTVTLYQDGVAVNTTAYSSTVNSNTQAVTIGSNATSTANNWNGYLSNVRVVKGTAVYTAAFTPPTAPLTAVTNTSLLTCQSSRFRDASTNAFTITRNGDTRVERFSPFSPSAAYASGTIGGSGYFDGTGDYLTTPSGQVEIQPGAGDFTIEFWYYFSGTATDYTTLFSYGSTGNVLRLFLYTSNSFVVWTGATNILTANNAHIRSAWNHVAVVRNGTTLTLYVNGASVGTNTGNSTNYVGSLSIAFESGQITFAGYLSNFRIVKGTAVYTAAFTPPTAPLTAITNTNLLLNFTNAGVIDNAMTNDVETVGNAQISNAQAKWGSTSISFDGTGDWLVMPDSPPQRLGTGDFTIEGWLRINATGVAYGVISKGTATTGWSVNVTSGNKLQFSYTATQLTGATSLAANTWYHFAVVRNGTGTGNLKIYLDGTADATSAGAVTDNFNQTNVQYVGANRTGGDALNGYVQDARVTTGYARYTANFTAPTAAFPTS